MKCWYCNGRGVVDPDYSEGPAICPECRGFGVLPVKEKKKVNPLKRLLHAVLRYGSLKLR